MPALAREAQRARRRLVAKAVFIFFAVIKLDGFYILFGRSTGFVRGKERVTVDQLTLSSFVGVYTSRQTNNKRIVKSDSKRAMTRSRG